MGQLDLGVTDARRTLVKKMLTPRMQGRLKDDEADHDKLKKRDKSNALMHYDLDGLVKEEGKINSNLSRVRAFNITETSVISWPASSGGKVPRRRRQQRPQVHQVLQVLLGQQALRR